MFCGRQGTEQMAILNDQRATCSRLPTCMEVFAGLPIGTEHSKVQIGHQPKLMKATRTCWRQLTSIEPLRSTWSSLLWGDDDFSKRQESRNRCHPFPNSYEKKPITKPPCVAPPFVLAYAASEWQITARSCKGMDRYTMHRSEC